MNGICATSNFVRSMASDSVQYSNFARKVTIRRIRKNYSTEKKIVPVKYVIKRSIVRSLSQSDCDRVLRPALLPVRYNVLEAKFKKNKTPQRTENRGKSMTLSTPPPSILQSTKINAVRETAANISKKRRHADSTTPDESCVTPNKRLVRSSSFSSSPVVHVSSDAMNELCFSRLNFGWSTLSLASQGSVKKSSKKTLLRQAFRSHSPAAFKSNQCNNLAKEDGKILSFRNTMFNKKNKKDGRNERNLRRHCSFNDSSTKRIANKSLTERRKSFGDNKRVGSVWLNVSLNDVLASKELLEAFRSFLKSEFSEENLDFWLECEELKNSKPSKVTKTTTKIYEKYIAVGSPREINLDSDTRKNTKIQILSGQSNSLVAPQKHIYDLMYRDSFPRFTLMKEFQVLADNIERENIKIKCAKEAKKSFRLKRPLSQLTSSIQIRKRKIYGSI